jgi:sensor domain CHASE-containing protein
MANNDPLEILLAALRDFEDNADPTQKKSAVLLLQRLAKKLEVRSWELQEQRWRLTAAEISGDKETLRALHEFSEDESIREWSAEVLAPNKARTLSYQTIRL